MSNSSKSPTHESDNNTLHDEEVASEAESSCEEEWQLLEESDGSGNEDENPEDLISKHDLVTAPIMTREAYLRVKSDRRAAQYGVLGRVLGVHHKAHVESLDDQRLYLNTNSPFSAIVCGVQGSGKSHTVSTILESMLISDFSGIGSLSKPLAGLVLHYGEGGASSLPNEAAWLANSISSHIIGPPVRVFVSRSSLQTMRTVYAPLGKRVTVEPLLLDSSELDAAAILSMMAVGSSESAPLYMQIILSILRDLGELYSYAAFMKKLEVSKQKFNPAQLTGLEQRLSLLTSFLDPTSSTQVKGKNIKSKSRFEKGHLTIVDLSDPFLDTSSACGLFEIIVRLFVRADVDTGKVLVVDEAHKYLSSERSASGLTKSLLNLIRQQRHLAMRVIISTQEPTVVPPVLLDLCSVAILHRFSSPNWWNHLIHHVPTDFSGTDAFDKVVRLQTGHAIVLAASGIGFFLPQDGTETAKQDEKGKVLTRFGRRYIIMKTRKRVTADGGASILVVDS
ncbi:hypothetical protein CPB83DRAFT_843792 [Crepidotus variabilis]|uniref:Zona occludens toxin N-terminal domain-containing protein n=1 Tax=Crepidotus variabilis TaxID=179855 RepID=A0A9P6ESS1_9AGAR|nr:hypothetical protein CPB83DRAFT_843792 [Crepidotus variabilis]